VLGWPTGPVWPRTAATHRLLAAALAADALDHLVVVLGSQPDPNELVPLFYYDPIIVVACGRKFARAMSRHPVSVISVGQGMLRVSQAAPGTGLGLGLGRAPALAQGGQGLGQKADHYRPIVGQGRCMASGALPQGPRRHGN